jgi:hypothetical protein
LWGYDIRSSTRSVSLILFLIFAGLHAGSASPVSAPDAATASPVKDNAHVIVIGFVGGYVRHDDMVHSAVQVGAHLRHDYPSGVYVDVIENHHREKALAEIVRFADTDHDGTLSVEEKQSVRIILYGHSWGASEAVTLARELGREGIPVLLTVQVDSVPKPGENDKVIPANVAEAANFYQLDGFLHGEPQISAADPTRTHIIGNFRFSYKSNPVSCKHYPWYDRVFMRSHTEIECDPKVWTQVESLIQSRLPAIHDKPDQGATGVSPVQ